MNWPRTAHRFLGAALTSALGLVLLSASAAHRPPVFARAAATEIVLELDPAQSKLHWTLGSTLHTVHGGFAIKRGTLRFDPASGRARGQIVADATSGETGNDSRDKKMHKEILESARYTDIVFRADRVDGNVSPEGTSSVQVHGTFLLHGAEHEMTVPVHADLSANHWKANAKFAVPYIAWGLKSPNTFLLKADPSVDVDLEMSGNVQGQGKN